ncbi:MAG: phosphonoacetaldehyde reductase [Eubacterium sp.]|nr:phosphonoacetaldehyde reductase [Eubacterium sp.]
MQTKQIIFSDYKKIGDILNKHGAKKPMLVCGKSFQKSYVFDYLKDYNIVVFDNIRPNPRFDDMVKAVEVFKNEGCDFMIAAGGGSPMDSAKMIRLMVTNGCENALTKPMENNAIPSLFIPTTSGTGSEATKVSVFYINENEKFSVHSYDFIPQYVLFDEKLLLSVDDYQRRCTCLDALCHCIESYWSTTANDESKGYAEKGVKLFFEFLDEYLANTERGNRGMLEASFYGGKAINITGTTAAHALCYNLTMNCNVAHGHSVAAVLLHQWDYMLNHNEHVNDARGRQYVLDTFEQLGRIMGGKNARDGYKIFGNLLIKLGMKSIEFGDDLLYDFIFKVNTKKLGTNPTLLDGNDVLELYKRVKDYGI